MNKKLNSSEVEAWERFASAALSGLSALPDLKVEDTAKLAAQLADDMMEERRIRMPPTPIGMMTKG